MESARFTDAYHKVANCIAIEKNEIAFTNPINQSEFSEYLYLLNFKFMKINELLLDFRTTSRCNMGCDLCFRNPGIDEQPLQKIREVITKMFHMGFRRIGFTGGEPTIRTDCIDMIEYAKKMGFLTYLSTVGNKFTTDLHLLNGILDWVGLPIDGIDYQTNAAVRSEVMGKQHEVIRDIFIFLANNPTTIKIKLTTVVTKANINELDSIVSFVTQLPYTFNVWRFYQFCPLGIGKSKQEKLEISTDEFLCHMNNLKAKYNDFPISWATFEERDKANVVMEPNFDVIIPNGDQYGYLCNMQKDDGGFIVASIIKRKDILKKCANNRFWVY